MSILAQFLKFAKNYIFGNKADKTILKRIVDFNDKNRVPEKIVTENTCEFCKKIFKKYCKKNSIILLNGRPLHPQTQGRVERYNRKIKELLKNIFIDKENKEQSFNIEFELTNAVIIHNNRKHSITGFIPESIFSTNTQHIFDLVKINTIKVKNIVKKS